MEEDNPAPAPVPLPGCFGCVGDVSMLAIALLVLGAAILHRADQPQMLPLIHAAAPVDPSDRPPIQFCAPVAPRGSAPDIPPVPGDDIT